MTRTILLMTLDAFRRVRGKWYVYAREVLQLRSIAIVVLTDFPKLNIRLNKRGAEI